jgi:hypothetical protein
MDRSSSKKRLLINADKQFVLGVSGIGGRSQSIGLCGILFDFYKFTI